MAAHALTILRQCLIRARGGILLTAREGEGVTTFVEQALSAPGTCCSAGFTFEAWNAVERANAAVRAGDGTIEAVLVPAIADAVKTVAWMDAYPSMESVRAAISAYVRVGTPHYRSRWAKFDAGDAAAHRAARALVTPAYGDRRAPNSSGT